MSYQEYIAERSQIDKLVEQGYHLKGVKENLSGAFVELELKQPDPSGIKSSTITLHIKNPDTRKYFAYLLLQQLKQTE